MQTHDTQAANTQRDHQDNTNHTIVAFENISMQFPGILANDNICLEITQGEIFALVGENGAGKSTLMSILYGLNKPTSGEVLIKNDKVQRFNPSYAIAQGVGMVHQHFMLVPSFTVAQNIVLSREPMKNKLFYDRKEAIRITRKLSKEYGLYVDPEMKVEDLSVGIRQRVEILKTLFRGAQVLILDEPTAVLTPSETDEFFATIKHIVKTKNMTIIIITHKLYEVMALSDRVGVMRAGKLVGILNTNETNERELAKLMIGRNVLSSELNRLAPEDIATTGDKSAIQTKDLSVLDNQKLKAVTGVSFEIEKGEIFGIAGVDGNGQSELIEALTGLREIESGQAMILGTDIKNLSPGQIRKIGLAHIPEDRLLTGLSKDANIADNLIMGKHRSDQFAIKSFQQRPKVIQKYAEDIFKQYDIRAADSEVLVGSLSGGNMQKVVIAREFEFGAPVLIISQPTRGVDIGANEAIHQSIIDKRNQGCAILLVSADLDELLILSDRIATMFEGALTATFKTSETTKSELSFYMAGAGKEKTSVER